MGAPVRIEDEAFSDVRFDVLATLCQLADADHARGKMAVLWRQCTQRHAYVLSAAVVAAVLGKDGASALVESGLGVVVDDGIRIRGTKGRIEWLKKLKKNASKGGRAKAARRQEVARAEAARRLALPCPPTLTLTPSITTTPTPVPEGEGAVAPPARAKSKRAASRAVEIPVDWSPCGGLGLSAAERSELDRFRDHHRSKGNTFVDIDAAWRNWMRRAPQFANSSQNNKPGSSPRVGRVEPMAPDQYPDGEVTL